MANTYIDLNTLKYLLYDVHDLKSVLDNQRFEDHDMESLNMFLDSVKEFSDRELFPYVKEMDEKPAHFKNGTVYVHKQVDTYMKKGGEMGLIGATFDYESGGMQLPNMVNHAATYIQDAANNHLPGYGALTYGSAELIVHFGNKALNDLYVPKMIAGEWQGTMCLTEPQAGSALSAIVTKARKTEQDYYNISGQKIFISGGDYQYANNVIHLVLARVEGAPSGTKGISLFVVPKLRVNEDGSLSKNDVMTIADFQKMGQRGYATTHLGFGDTDDCRGWLVGEENKGLQYMFLMMNSARISVGRGASAIAMAAYQASLEYANERAQGKKLPSATNANPDKNPCLIIEHPDVRRMLLLQKTIVEGTMSMVFKTSKYQDLFETTSDEAEKNKYNLLLELLTPIVKTYPSEAAIHSINNGVQVLGGYGFCADFILQQYARDIRIFSLYEGTTGIQSQDLLGRKVTMANGKALELLAGEIMASIQKASKINNLQSYAQELGKKLQLTNAILDFLLPFAKKGDYERYLADANLFMEYVSVLIMSWLWLDIAIDATKNIEAKNVNYSNEFYESKIHSMQFYFKYELSKMSGLAKSIMHNDSLTTSRSNNIFL
jgi:butyryl-CoA dehydrogenase